MKTTILQKPVLLLAGAALSFSLPACAKHDRGRHDATSSAYSQSSGKSYHSAMDQRDTTVDSRTQSVYR